MKRFDELQLAFDLELDEDEELAAERAISYEEARQVSEAAFGALQRRIEDLEVKKYRPGWVDDFVKLREQGWPWRVAVYIAWAASPKALRWPKTLKELAETCLGLQGPRTIYTWRGKFPGIDTTVAMLQAAPLFEHRRDVLEALVRMASTPDYKSFNDRKLFLEMVGDYVPKSQLDLGKSGAGDELESLTDAELLKLAGRLDELKDAGDAAGQDEA